MKRILVIQDLSCVGSCSLTVALPILSAMGIRCSVLPTAVLSTHTAFPDPHTRDLTEDIGPVCDHWQSVGASFDAILVGYLSDPRQAEAVLDVMLAFDCPVILDPVLGDRGKLYTGITPEHIAAMADLAAMAQVVLPNVTEAAFLTDVPYQEQTDGQYLRMMLEKLCRMKTRTVIITGTSPSQDQTGFAGILKGEGLFSYRADRRTISSHGTGDMFSAVFAGAYLLGKDPVEAGELAAGFVERVLDATEEASPFGANFESQLPWLWQQL
ncbi:MAG: pyridoxamine kinase [Oscillospiraceae bacterium]|nr:pyridoxamine kinase [Oscillospiraceae bacterium]